MDQGGTMAAGSNAGFSLDRRTALAGIAGVFGVALFAPLARAAGYEPIPKINTGKPAVVFTPAQRALVAALSERIMPTTDTPGAKAAGVPAYIEQVLADWATPQEVAMITGGLDTVEARAKADHGKAGAALEPAQLDALLTLSMNGQLGDPAFFKALKEMVLFGYYTSEIGFTVERVFVPVPGTYDGAYPYEKVGRIMVG